MSVVMPKNWKFTNRQQTKIRAVLNEASHNCYGDVIAAELDNETSVDAKVGITVIEHDGAMDCWSRIPRWKGVVIAYEDRECTLVIAYDLFHGGEGDFFAWSIEELWQDKWNTTISTESFGTPEYKLVDREPTWCLVDGKYK
jgi:hypothetical protein